MLKEENKAIKDSKTRDIRNLFEYEEKVRVIFANQ